MRRYTLFSLSLSAIVVAGCNFASYSDAPDNVDVKTLYGGGSAILMTVNGQSAMLGSDCVRRAGSELQQRKAQGAMVEELRAYLRDTCAITAQTAQSSNVARPSRGRLFAPMKYSDGAARSTGGNGYYAWYLNPLIYWSSAYADNRRFCSNLFYGAWTGGDCFDLFSTVRTYRYYRPYCQRQCLVTHTTTATASADLFAPTATSCIRNSCYGQWLFY